jgi:hypothetical protein
MAPATSISAGVGLIHAVMPLRFCTAPFASTAGLIEKLIWAVWPINYELRRSFTAALSLSFYPVWPR